MGTFDNNNTAGSGGGPNFSGPAPAGSGGSGDGSNPYDLGDSGDNNKQEGHAPGLGAWSQGLGTSSSFEATGPDKKAYGGFISNAAANANTFLGKGDAAENRSAAQINNQFQGESRGNLGQDRGNLGGLLNQLQGEANGTQPTAGAMQFQHGLDSSIASQMAMANSTRGGATAAAGATRNAAQQGVQTQAAATSQAAQQAAQEQWQAQQLYGQVANNMSANDMSQYGLEQGDAEKQAAFDEQQNGLNDNYSLGLYGDANQNNAMALQGLNAYTEGNTATQKINAQTADSAAKGGGGLFDIAKNFVNGATGGMLGGGGGGGGGGGAAADGGDGGGEAAGGDGGMAAAARGGNLRRGQPTLVGEQGPELVLPKKNGYVMTAQQTAALLGAPPTGKQVQDLQADAFLRHIDPKAHASRNQAAPSLAAVMASLGRMNTRIKELEGKRK